MSLKMRLFLALVALVFIAFLCTGLLLPILRSSSVNLLLTSSKSIDAANPPTKHIPSEALRPWFEAKCARFKTRWNVDDCRETWSNGWATGIEDQPPCGVALNKEMLRLLHQVFNKLNLPYSVMFGTLLGLVRNDRLIPWTIDNDIGLLKHFFDILFNAYAFGTDDTVLQAFDEVGLALLNDGADYLMRVCFTSKFQNGILERLWPDTEENKKQYYTDNYPYVDIYSLEMKFDQVKKETSWRVNNMCNIPDAFFRPLLTRTYYKNTVEVKVPAQPEKVLEILYGPDWRFEDKNHGVHGNGKYKCS